MLGLLLPGLRLFLRASEDGFRVWGWGGIVLGLLLPGLRLFLHAGEDGEASRDTDSECMVQAVRPVML